MVKKILVVDDDEDIRNSVKTVLEKNGYRVITAVDGDDGLKKCEKEKPDLVLLDIMMPGTPIREIIPKMKNTKLAYLSVVRVSEAEKENLLGRNVRDFIQKPFDIKELIRRIKKLVG